MPEFCTDPAGLDRQAVHEKLNAAILDFFNQQLRDAETEPRQPK